MATNKLFEAASDILASTKGKNAEPLHKVEGEVVDLGGPTPFNDKPTDDSAKLDVTKSAKHAEAPKAHPSDASPDTQNKLKKEDVDSDINALFADDSTISEDFKSKASTIFEARVYDRVSKIQEDMEAEYAYMLEESVNTIKEELSEKLNDYLSYVVEQWVEENRIAIESSLRSEMTQDFIAGLRNLFAEHYIEVPEEKVDLVEELAVKVSSLEDQLNEEIERGIEMKKTLSESRIKEITREVCEGLTATQFEKIKSLAESVEFTTESEYATKIETIRENYFPLGIKKAGVEQLHEQVEDAQDKAIVADPYVASVMQAISKTKTI